MNITGGSIGDCLGIEAVEDSTITFIGSFNFAYGDYVNGGLLDDDALLTGTLADGTAISNIVTIGGSATITLVPEPSSLALASLGLILCVWHRRRR